MIAAVWNTTKIIIIINVYIEREVLRVICKYPLIQKELFFLLFLVEYKYYLGTNILSL